MENSIIKILAIDDNLDNLIILKALIDEAFPNAQTLTALSGKKGLQLAFAEDPDVILLDIVMPEMDGFEVCRKLKEDDILADIPVVFVTAIKGDREHRIKALELGAEAFIAKPIDETELKAQIRAMFKIKKANIDKRSENQRLSELVDERTAQLKEELEERLRAESSLKESELRFKQVSDEALEWIWEVDTEGIYTYSSTVVESLLGYKPEELIGKIHFYDLFTPEYKKNLMEQAREIFEKKESFKHLVNPNVHKDGHIVILETNGSPIFNSEGKVVGYRGVDADITQRKIAEEKIRESEAQFRSIFQNAADAIFIADMESGIIVDANQNAGKLIKMPIEKIIGMHQSDLHPPEYNNFTKETFNNHVSEIIEKNISNPVINEIIRSDGTRVPVEVLASNVIYHGKPCIMGTFRDITERKKVDEAIIKTGKYYQTLLEKAPDGIVLLNPNGKICYASPSAKRMFGYDDDFVEFPEPNEATHPEDLPYVLETLGKVIHNPSKVETIEYRFRTSDNKWKWIESTFSNQFAEPGIESIIINFRDITDRKIAEIALLDSKQQLHRMISNLPGFVYICQNDENYTMEFISDGCTEITGYSPNDFMDNRQITFPDIMFSEDIGDVRLKWKTALANREHFEYEYRIKNSNGEIRWIWERGNGVFSDNGELLRLEGFITDVTKRKQVEEKLNENFTLMRIAGEKAKLGGWNVVLDEYRSYWSDVVAAIHEMPAGYSPIVEDEIKFYAPEWRDRITKVFTDCAQNGIPYDEEMEIITSTGKRVWIRTIGEAVKDTNGKIYKVHGAFQDISDQKEAERKIREKDIQFRKLTANLKDLIFQFTRRPDGTYCVPIASEGIENIFGCKPEDVIDNFDAIARVLHPEDVERVINDIEFSAKYLSYFTCEFRVQIPGKPVQWILSKSNPEQLPDGSITWYGFNANITDSKNAEKALMESEKKYRQLFQNLTTGFALHEIILDNDGKPCDYRFLEVNPYFEKLTGLKSYNLYGKTILEVLPDTESEWIETYGKVALTGESIIFENFSKVLNKYYQVTAYSPEPMKFATVFLDISERKQAELLLTEQNHQLEEQYEEYMKLNEVLRVTNYDLEIAIDKAQESDRLKSAFLANMSHEIRTPMNGILGFTELLKDPDITGDEQQEFITIIQKSGARMLNIINDIIDISKIESGLVDINTQVTNINEQIEYIYNFFKPQVEEKGLYFSIKKSLPDEDAHIKTDREKLYAILTNIVKNAIKYTHSGSIEFGYFPIEKENQIQFYVKDTGIGIPHQRHEAIFERFVQADIEDRHAYQGAGLGLTITKSYIELLGGRIWVESEEGKGSTFYFTIPYNNIYNERNKMEMCSENSNVDKKNLKILIAEDDETSSMLMTISLKSISEEIFKARTGDEAVEICRNNPDIDLILMDIKMPGLNGYEATQQIREFNKDVVIIAQTAYGLTGDREKTIEAGCNDYIAKPIVIDKLQALIYKYFK